MSKENEEKTISEVLEEIRNEMFHLSMYSKAMIALGMESGIHADMSISTVLERLDEVQDIERANTRRLFEIQQQGSVNMINAALAASKVTKENESGEASA